MEEAEYLYDVDYYIDQPTYYKNTLKKHKGELYRCTRCGKYKPKSEFYKDSRVPCGIRSKCKECYHK